MEWPDVMALYDYWAEHPPTHIILAARYLDQSKKRGKAPRSEQAATEQLQSIGQFMGAPQKLPEHLKDAMKWALDFKRKPS